MLRCMRDIRLCRATVLVHEKQEKEEVVRRDAPEGRETAVVAVGSLARFVCHFIHDSTGSPDHVPSICLAPFASRPSPRRLPLSPGSDRGSELLGGCSGCCSVNPFLGHRKDISYTILGIPPLQSVLVHIDVQITCNKKKMNVTWLAAIE